MQIVRFVRELHWAPGRTRFAAKAVIGAGAASARLFPATSLAIAGALLLFFNLPAFSQCTSCSQNLPANDFLRKAIDAELKAQAADHSHWMYQLEEDSAGKKQVKWVIETDEGDLDRLQSVNGRPIAPHEVKTEDQRIENLIHRPSERRRRQRAQQQDSHQTERLLKVLPDAVTARYGERKGDLVEILFSPNPNFHPPSHEATVFHHMDGHIWIEAKENRLAEIDGHLIDVVKFGGGWLGYLDKGGEFHVQQTEVAPHYWEVTLLHVNMHGKALFFKSIGVQQHEVRSNFRRIDDKLTLSEAADELRKRSAIASLRQDTTQSWFATANADSHPSHQGVKKADNN